MTMRQSQNPVMSMKKMPHRRMSSRRPRRPNETTCLTRRPASRTRGLRNNIPSSESEETRLEETLEKTKKNIDNHTTTEKDKNIDNHTTTTQSECIRSHRQSATQVHRQNVKRDSCLGDVPGLRQNNHLHHQAQVQPPGAHHLQCTKLQPPSSLRGLSVAAKMSQLQESHESLGRK